MQPTRPARTTASGARPTVRTDTPSSAGPRRVAGIPTEPNSNAIATEKQIEQPISTEQVNVGINALEDTWLRLIKDKSDTSEYLLRQGNNLALSSDSTMEFLIGKANGLNMTINSNNIGVLGKSGEVVSYLKVTKDGVAAKRLKKVIIKDSSNDSTIVN